MSLEQEEQVSFLKLILYLDLSTLPKNIYRQQLIFSLVDFTQIWFATTKVHPWQFSLCQLCSRRHHHFAIITIIDKHQVMESYQDEKIIGEKESDEDESEVDKGKIAKEEL